MGVVRQHKYFLGQSLINKFNELVVFICAITYFKFRRISASNNPSIGKNDDLVALFTYRENCITR